MAAASIARPNASTIPSSTSVGTGQPHHAIGPDARLERLGRVQHHNLHAVHDRDAVAELSQVDHREHLVHPVRDGAAVDAVQLGVQAQVLRRGEVAVERRVLEHQADVPADLVALTGDVEAAHAGGAGGGPRERAEHVDRRALAGAVRAEEAEDLAASDREGHATDGLDLAVGLDEVLDLDGP